MNTESVSQYYRKKLEQHELTAEEWSAVRYAVIKHTLIAAASTITLGMCTFSYARSRSWSRLRCLTFGTGLAFGGAIAMESGMKSVEKRLEGSGSELLYLMDRYSRATVKERLKSQLGEEPPSYEIVAAEQKSTTPRMIRVNDSKQ
ncbi:hypothetical protein EDD21DRAFT_410768 [Dissophora ornata]|nr:hypothetical protein EDD21DRAFT_410768 [Dissophora ornata]